MFEIITEIEIATCKEDIWEILTDFDQYSAWNPFIVNAVRKNDRLTIATQLKDERPMTFNPTIIECRENEELRWIGSVGSECLLKAEHYFLLETTEQGNIRLIQGEIFSGMLTCTMNARKKSSIQAGFNKMNEQLSEKALTLTASRLQHDSGNEYRRGARL